MSIRENETFDSDDIEGAPAVRAGLGRVAAGLKADEALFARSRDSVRMRLHDSNAPSSITETDNPAGSNGLADTVMQTAGHWPSLCARQAYWTKRHIGQEGGFRRISGKVRLYLLG